MKLFEQNLKQMSKIEIVSIEEKPRWPNGILLQLRPRYYNCDSYFQANTNMSLKIHVMLRIYSHLKKRLAEERALILIVINEIAK